MILETVTPWIVACGIALPPGVTAHRLDAIAWVESRMNTRAISPPNSDGSRDYGLLQLNDQHIGKPGFPRSAAEALEICPNLAAGVRILADADHAAGCIYNTGKPDCRRKSGTNGYPEKIRAAFARMPITERVTQHRREPQPMRPQPFDLFQRERQRREAEAAAAGPHETARGLGHAPVSLPDPMEIAPR